MMRKIFSAILLILTTNVAVKAQQIIFNQTFEDAASLFQGFVLSNLDKADPIGIEWDTLRSVPWFVSTAGVTGNHAAIATSDYLADTAADDWFITPAIRIGAASQLSWKSLSLTSGKTDSYQVYISTVEQSVTGCLFNKAVGNYTSSNSTAFTSNTVDLAKAGYADRTIFIGFRLNTKSGGDKIAIDDIQVTENSSQFVALKFVVNMSNYITKKRFNPTTDKVDVAGTFNGYSGTKNILTIVPGTDSTVYTTTIPGFIEGDQLEFKFRINSSWNDSAVEFPFGQPNRIWVVEKNKYTYSCFYNDLESSSFGIPENKLMDQVTVYPNPAETMVWIGIPKNINKVSLVNLTGQKILDRETVTGNIVNLDLNSVPKGTYLLLFYTNQGFGGSKKMIKN